MKDVASKAHHPPFEAERFHYRLHSRNEFVARPIDFLASFDLWPFGTVKHK